MENMQWLFWVALVASGVWMCWMATCRPEQWERLVENDRRRKKETINGLFKAGAMGWKIYKGMR